MTTYRHFMCRAVPAVVLSLLSIACSHDASAQAQRTVHIIVPFNAGGTADTLARVVADQINKAQGPQGPNMLVENRPGGGASIAYDYVARSAPDGNTVVINANSLVINPLLRKVTYDPIASFEPVCLLVSSPQAIVVNSASPYRTLGDFVTAAQANPGKLSFATVGPATTQHIAFEQFRHLAGLNLIYVPYTGGAPAITALLGGHVDGVLANFSEVVEQVHGGKLRALAATTRTRIPSLPDAPTAAEAGYKDYEAAAWFGVAAPAKTPKEATAELIALFSAAMQVPEVQKKLISVGLYPVERTCGADFGQHVRKQAAEYADVIRTANLKPE